jgi:branched-chain amino acid aminotransferase
MGAWVNFNGKFKAEGTALITADNRGFRYGDGIFETIRTAGPDIPLWELHADRLFRGIESLSLPVPALLTKDAFKNEILATLNKNKITRSGRVRLTIFRGDGGLFETEGKGGGYLIQTWPMDPHQSEYNSNGLVLGIYEDGLKSCDRLSGIKSNSYLLSVMAALFAKKNKFNDAIILNTHKRICESSIANIFWVSNKNIFTPPLSEGCVAGVMRQHLISHAAVTEKSADPDEISSADEIFLTNAVYRLRWVKRINHKEFDNKLSREIFQSTI